jgi:hypothetical protein
MIKQSNRFLLSWNISLKTHNKFTCSLLQSSVKSLPCALYTMITSIKGPTSRSKNKTPNFSNKQINISIVFPLPKMIKKWNKNTKNWWITTTKNSTRKLTLTKKNRLSCLSLTSPCLKTNSMIESKAFLFTPRSSKNFSQKPSTL